VMAIDMRPMRKMVSIPLVHQRDGGPRAMSLVLKSR